MVGINNLRETSQTPCEDNPQTITIMHKKVRNWLFYFWKINSPPKNEKIDCECGKENKDGINKEGETNVTLGQDYRADQSRETKSKYHQYPWQVMLSSNLSPKVMKEII